ncbi:MAG: hypothetical protein K2M46_13435 [Lachnospiraceae bacterium]|nr:hypothetical protein [Lachnospiraceae bacterium]
MAVHTEIFVCFLLTLGLLWFFYIFGKTFCQVVKMEQSCFLYIICGFFLYYSLFQFLAFPMILLQSSLSVLTIIWCVLLVLLLCVCIGAWHLVSKCDREKQLFSIKGKKFWKKERILQRIGFAVPILFLMYYVWNQNYWGWDSASYLGTISTVVDSDSMYTIHGESGKEMETIPMRYALSCFYMHSAVICKMTGISPEIWQKYAMAGLCVLLYGMLMYKLAQELFSKDKASTLLFVWVICTLNFFFVSEYSTAQFLLFRSYEAKGFCGNVIFPAILLALLWIHRHPENLWNYKYLFLVMVGTVPISMSAILIAPVLVVIGCGAHILTTKCYKEIKYVLCCLLPGILYLLLYYLYTVGIFVIHVKR